MLSQLNIKHVFLPTAWLSNIPFSVLITWYPCGIFLLEEARAKRDGWGGIAHEKIKRKQSKNKCLNTRNSLSLGYLYSGNFGWGVPRLKGKSLHLPISKPHWLD